MLRVVMVDDRYPSPICTFLMPSGKLRRLYPRQSEVDIEASLGKSVPVLKVDPKKVFSREAFGTHEVVVEEDEYGSRTERAVVHDGIFFGFVVEYVGRCRGRRTSYRFREVQRLDGYLAITWHGDFKRRVESSSIRARLAKLRLTPGLHRGLVSATGSQGEDDPEQLVKKLEFSIPIVVEKFGSEEAFRNELTLRPVTTLVSLGRAVPPEARKMRSALCTEWAPHIVALSRSFAKRNKSLVVDFIQDCNLSLIEALNRYTSGSDASTSRFDRFAAHRIRLRLLDRTRSLKRREQLLDDPDVASVSSTPFLLASELSTDDQADYLRVTERAQAIILRLLVGSDLHPTYKRLLENCFFCEGRQVTYNQLATRYDVWEDPTSRVEVPLLAKSTKALQLWMDKWRVEAVEVLRSTLSVGCWQTDEERLVSILLGSHVRANRVLTSDGQTVRRWLELEVQLQRPGQRRTFVPARDTSLVYSLEKSRDKHPQGRF